MKKKRVGIDARLLYQTGVGVYLRNLLFNLAKVNDQNTEIVVFAKKDDWSRFLSEYSLSTQHFAFRICDVSWHSFSEQIVFAWQLYKANLDIVHFPYFSWPILYFKPFVATVHDTILLKHATGRATTLPVVWYRIKNAVFRLVFWLQVKRAKTIFTPSKAVQSEVVGYDKGLEEKVIVTYEGVDEVFAKSSAQKPDSFPYEEKSYFLYVGNAYPHKNVEMLLEAFQHFKVSGVSSQLSDKNLKLVLVGPKSIFADRLKEKYRDLGDVVLWLQDVKTAELKWLYANAKALVFPSKAEGFGLPIVEAMSVGCPLILSDIPVFREVAVNGAIFFNSNSVDSLASALGSVENPRSKIGAHATEDLSFYQMAMITAKYY